MNASGKTAPSFMVTLVLLILGVVGYLAWDILSPNPVARSEMVVRNFGAAAASELSSLRRELRVEVQRYKSAPSNVASVRAVIDEDVAAARESVEELANQARDELGFIDGIGLRTQDNRLQRIKTRQGEAESRIEALGNEARGELPLE